MSSYAEQGRPTNARLNDVFHYKDRGKEVRLSSDSLPSEPDVRFSRIRLSS